MEGDARVLINTENQDRQAACTAIDKRAVELSDLVRQNDNKHDEQKNETDAKLTELGESMLEIVNLRELDQTDLKQKLDLVLENMRSVKNEMGIKVFETQENVIKEFGEKITETQRTIEEAKGNLWSAIEETQADVGGVYKVRLRKRKRM